MSNVSKKNKSSNALKPMLAVVTLKKLPPLGQIVEATVRFTRNWPECLGGLKITDKTLLVRRIKSSNNSQGWQWSGSELDTQINGNVVEWHYR